jgi:hypothetical protein
MVNVQKNGACCVEDAYMAAARNAYSAPLLVLLRCITLNDMLNQEQTTCCSVQAIQWLE